MQMSRIAMIFAGLALVAAPFVAAAEEAPAPKEKKERLICKRYQRIGSLAGYQRVCGTREWWDKEQAASRKWTEGAIDSCRTRGESPLGCQ